MLSQHARSTSFNIVDTGQQHPYGKRGRKIGDSNDSNAVLSLLDWLTRYWSGKGCDERIESVDVPNVFIVETKLVYLEGDERENDPQAWKEQKLPVIVPLSELSIS